MTQALNSWPGTGCMPGKLHATYLSVLRLRCTHPWKVLCRRLHTPGGQAASYYEAQARFFEPAGQAHTFCW